MLIACDVLSKTSLFIHYINNYTESIHPLPCNEIYGTLLSFYKVTSDYKLVFPISKAHFREVCLRT